MYAVNNSSRVGGRGGREFIKAELAIMPIYGRVCCGGGERGISEGGGLRG